MTAAQRETRRTGRDHAPPSAPKAPTLCGGLDKPPQTYRRPHLVVREGPGWTATPGNRKSHSLPATPRRCGARPPRSHRLGKSLTGQGSRPDRRYIRRFKIFDPGWRTWARCSFTTRTSAAAEAGLGNHVRSTMRRVRALGRGLPIMARLTLAKAPARVTVRNPGQGKNLVTVGRGPELTNHRRTAGAVAIHLRPVTAVRLDVRPVTPRWSMRFGAVLAAGL